MNIIDSISAGYRLIARRPWLLLVPVLVDLFLWMGPRISIAGVVRDISVGLTGLEAAGLNEEMAAALAQIQQVLDQLGSEANLLVLLAWGIPGIPSLIAAVAPSKLAMPLAAMLVEVPNGTAALGISLGLILLGTLVASLYVNLIGREVLGVFGHGPSEPAPLTQATFTTWWRIILFVFLALIVVLLFSSPFVLLGTFITLLSPTAGMIMMNLLSLALMVLAVWLVVYLFFVVDSLVLNRAGVMQAIWNSINVVMRNFWPALGLILLINIINAGMILIWQQLTFSTWGTALAIAGNAFVSTGLVAASLIFYFERYQRWQQAPGPVFSFGRFPSSHGREQGEQGDFPSDNHGPSEGKFGDREE